MQPIKEHITIRLSPHQFCKNCEGAIYDTFCGNCGQKHIEGKLTINLFVEEFISKFFGIDSAIFRTVKGWFKPGRVCQEFLSGKRKKYMRPLTFYLAFLALYFYLDSFRDNDTLKFTMDVNSEGRESFERAINWLKTQTKLIFMISVPVNAYQTFLFYRKSEYNYLENLIIWLYLKGYILLFLNFNTLVVPSLVSLFGVTGNVSAILSWIVPITFGTYALMQVFDHFSIWGAIKASFTYFSGFVLSSLIGFIGVGGVLAFIDYFFLTPG